MKLVGAAHGCCRGRPSEVEVILGSDFLSESKVGAGQRLLMVMGLVKFALQ